MLIENMKMALSALRANKMRSFLTMLGIIIGIGSVIAITSVGDTMRKMFSDIYQDVGVTQGYISISYQLEDVRESDYFTMDDMENYKEVFGDRLAYIDSGNSVTGDIVTDLSKKNFYFYGIDYNYIDVQPVNIVYGRYLNEADILARKPNCVIDRASAEELYGSAAAAVGKTFRITVYGSVTEFNIIGVFEKEQSAFTALMTGSSANGEAYIPWTLLTWPNDLIYQIHFFADPDMNAQELEKFNEDFAAYGKD